MYYKNHSDIPSLPYVLEQKIIEIAENNIKMNVPLFRSYSGYETLDKNSCAYVDPGTEGQDTNGELSGGVGIYMLDDDMNDQICKFYNAVNHPLIQNRQYYIQIVSGGNFVGPHVDWEEGLVNDGRQETILYLIKAGGSNVRTRWYELKDEYKHLKVTAFRVIPYERLDLVEDHCLEERTWHFFNHAKIHSVENQESLRIALIGHP